MWAFLRDWLTPQGILAVGMIYAAIQAQRARRASVANARALEIVSGKVEAVHLATNSIVTAALKAKDDMGVVLAAAGVAEGREQMRVEQKNEEKP